MQLYQISHLLSDILQKFNIIVNYVDKIILPYTKKNFIKQILRDLEKLTPGSRCFLTAGNAVNVAHDLTCVGLEVENRLRVKHRV